MSAPSTPPAPLTLDVDALVEFPPPADVDLDRLHALVPYVLEQEGAGGVWTVVVVLAGDDRLRTLHRDFLGIDTATDVMTFPFGDGPPAGPPGNGGEIVISVEHAAAQAPDYGHTPAEEVPFLLVHGLLHLCGWTDADEADRARMLQRQTDLIAAFDRLPAETGSGRAHPAETAGGE
jgi:probable rRNA maturation factor